MDDAADAHAEAALGAANDGYVAGTYFARWNPTQDVRTLVHVILGGPAEKEVQDFYDGFIAGAEAEQQRRSEPHDDEVPFALRWLEQVEISRGDTGWIVGPQAGPWRPKPG
ncbi:MAG: hypothetical protein Q4P07_13595 [Ornithinimicrobium sp.]|uniref:hypothetical protein n=1 Tax=Ornithinimicrobium sp. TaxID=1977084 RepID=UPI0026E0212D|nr:hypothetical protein [Ornithinimicrobium sp.]MDO5741171.1 hypothetical protein [Ornithinimicrobium sp.]